MNGCYNGIKSLKVYRGSSGLGVSGLVCIGFRDFGFGVVRFEKLHRAGAEFQHVRVQHVRKVCDEHGDALICVRCHPGTPLADRDARSASDHSNGSRQSVHCE